MSKIKIPEVSPVRVPVDIDVNPDGHLANVTCLPEFMSNDYALIYSTASSTENRSFCATFFAETKGVIGDGYTNCITADGKLTTDKDGNLLSGAAEELGKERLASLLAQAYDCYVQQKEPNELTQFLWNVPFSTSTNGMQEILWNTNSSSDTNSLSQLMWKYEPLIKTTALPLDIDQDSQQIFPPTAGTVSADPKMVDDFVFIYEPEIDLNTGLLIYCFQFESELFGSPYGAGAYGYRPTVCLSEGGDVFVSDWLSNHPKEARIMQNIGNVLNAYFSSSSDFAQEIVANEKELTMPEKPAPKEDLIEGQSAFSQFLNEMAKQTRETAEHCRENPWSCGAESGF